MYFFPLALGFFIYINIIIYSTSPTLLLPMTTTMVAATATFILSPLDSPGSVYHCTALVWLLGCDWKERVTGEKALLRMPTHTFTRTLYTIGCAVYRWPCTFSYPLHHPPLKHTPLPFSPPLSIHKPTEPRRFFFSIPFFFFASASSGDIGCALGVQTVWSYTMARHGGEG